MVGGEDILSCCGADRSATLQGVLNGVKRLLDPSMEEAAAAYVGQLIDTLIQKLPNVMNPFLPQLVEALVQKLRRSSSSQVGGASCG